MAANCGVLDHTCFAKSSLRLQILWSCWCVAANSVELLVRGCKFSGVVGFAK